MFSDMTRIDRKKMDIRHRAYLMKIAKGYPKAIKELMIKSIDRMSLKQIDDFYWKWIELKAIYKFNSQVKASNKRKAKQEKKRKADINIFRRLNLFF